MGGVIHRLMIEHAQSETTVFDRMKLHLWPDVLSQTEAQVSSERWQLRLWLSPLMHKSLKPWDVFYER